MKQRYLFWIHLFTATGAALAVLAVLAAFERDWFMTFVWLGVALAVDGADGPMARKAGLKERMPHWDGAQLDNVIDYTTFVFIPAVIVALALDLTDWLGACLGALIALTGALYYAGTEIKQPDNSFRGFPVVWNMAVFVLFVLMPPPAVTTLVVVALAILTFVPVNFVHPVRVEKWRPLTLAVMAVWAVAAGWALASGFDEPAFIRLLLLVSTLYLAVVSAIHQYLRKPKSA